MRETFAPDLAPGELPLEQFPDESHFDVAVVGGGPNGLMTAAYLARAGLSTVVVERRHEIGGGLATEEVLFPGYYSNVHAVYHMMTDYMPLFADFDFAKHGLTFIKPNAQTASVFADGSSLLLCSQVEDTKDSIAKFSRKDAISFGKVMRTWRRIVDEVVAPATYLPPVPPLDMIEAFERTETGREALRLTEMSPVEIVDEIFTDDRVKMTILYAACMWGLDPTDTGLGFMVPLLVDRAVNKGICFGGSHKLAGALSREIHAAGGLIVDNAEVTGVIVEDGHAAGIEMFDGRRIMAKAVVSSLDPQTNFLRLIGRDHVDADLVSTAEDWEWDKWSFFTVSLALTEAPRYRADDPWVDKAVMTVLGFDSTDELLAHWAAVADGRLGPRLGGHATCETLYDPTLARMRSGSPHPWAEDPPERAGARHHVAFLQMHAPYDLDGDAQTGWKQRQEELVDATVETWARYAPNIAGATILRRTGETPLDIERRLPNMVRGSIKHGDYNPLQMGTFRPSDLCVAGRTPIEGFYLCGASTYPGGLVIGGPGYIAANTVAEDLGVEKWWSPPRHVARFAETYLS
ncbi:MAG: NAD(P)/FAD-dependent oxidoreductase [Acidimicrobiia bacterium]|nr:NAD(P)/FAD-dependent oxidoreductase [Acidimicrobiia bacterium]